VAAPASQIEVSGAAFVPICLKAHGGLLVVGPSIGYCQNSSACTREITPGRTLLRWVQIALKPASKALGLHGVFIRGKGLKDLIADSAFKRMQVNAQGACWLDADEHHLGLAPRTGRALNCGEWNDGQR
jgi:hypothetical protein